ncbi:MAG: nucleotidyltransferase domain-containing protein [Parcubacteria group bacterium]
MENNIIATLAYYDTLDWPLTAREVFRYLVKIRHSESGNNRGDNDPSDISENAVRDSLDRLVNQGNVSKFRNFYFLFGRRYLIPLRRKKYRLAGDKIDKTKDAVSWLRHVPFVKAISASGSLALGNTSELSDLDIFVITRKGYIWTVRFLISFVLSCLGVRRTNKHFIAPDKVCANHFITDKSLDIPFHSMYTAQLYANLIPMLALNDDIVIEFKEQNRWLLDYIYRWDTEMTDIKPSWIANTFEWILDLSIGKFIEKHIRSYQIRRIESGNKKSVNKGRITYNDNQLEFHPSSPEGRIIPGYNKRLINAGLSSLAIETDSGLK